MNSHLRHLLICTAFAFASNAGAQTPEYRSWTDRTTGKQIEATMVSADSAARTVTIKTKDGKDFTLPVARFVDADLAYIKQKLSAPQSAPPAPPPAPTPKPAEPKGAPPAPAKTDDKAAPKAAPPAPAPAPTPAAPKGPVGQPAPAAPKITLTSVKKFKFPAGNSVLGAVKKERPRLLLNAAGMNSLKALIESDATAKAMFEALKATQLKVIELPELVQIRGEGGRGTSIGAKLIFRMTGLGILNYVDGDPKWKDYAIREMVSSASFTNWRPDELGDLTEFVWGMSIGYDMFRKSMTPKDEAKIKTALVQLGVDSLLALFKGEDFPATTKRAEPGQAPFTKAFPNKRPAIAKQEEPDGEELAAACALLMSAIALSDEDPARAGHAATLACKVIGEGVRRFGPDGVWAEGIYAGDDVLDPLASLIMTLRAAAGNDFGLTTLDALANANTARMHMNGPTGVFNYGDARGGTLGRVWLTSFLASIYGNPGVPAVVAPKAPVNTETQGMGLAGQLLYHSAYMSGYGKPEALDANFSTAHVATLRSAWNDPGAYFVAIKGGENKVPGSQLELGTFVLDAGGVRWGVDLGAENDRAMKDHINPAKFKNYRENTFGQNTWTFGSMSKDIANWKPVVPKKGPPDPPANCQPLDAKAPIVAFNSTPERGVAVVDLTHAYSTHAKDFMRGIMMNRGDSPYVIVQDELKVKSGDPEWAMHTRAEVTTEGNKAVLKSGNKTLTMTVLSPAGATIVAEDAPEQKEPNTSVKGVKVIKIPLKGVKNQNVTVSVAFALGETAPSAAVVPIAQWTKKK